MKLIILDRDGVINYDSKHYIKNPDEFIPIPGSLEALASLSKRGYTLAVATNQSGIARGLYDEVTLSAIHEKCQRALATLGGKIDLILHCPHHPDDHCLCRKPKPGLLQQIAVQFQMPLDGVPFIGDSYRDLLAAKHAGCKPVLVKTGNGLATWQQHGSQLTEVEVFNDLRHYVESLS